MIPAQNSSSGRAEALEALATAIDDGRTWDNFTADLKSPIRRYLHGRQLGRCSYCERALLALDDARAHRRLKIDHFCPQNPDATELTRGSAECQDAIGVVEDADLAIENLLLCCEGHAPPPEYAGDPHDDTGGLTCDASKGNSHICGMGPNPNTQLALVEERVALDGSYVISGIDERFAQAQVVASTRLNLDRPSLVDARRDLLMEVKRNLTARLQAGATTVEDATTGLQILADRKPYRSVYLTVVRTLTASRTAASSET